jgi:ankyrin repeat protein
MNLAVLRWLWLALLAVVCVRADEFAFFDAVSGGDASSVGESLAAGVDPNYADEDGLTPLILAAKHGRLEVIA